MKTTTLLPAPLILAAALLAPISARAADTPSATTLVDCSGTSRSEFSPGLLLQPQDTNVQVHGSLTSCVSPGNQVTSATYDQHFLAKDRSCLDPIDTRSSTKTYTWNDGTTSVFSYSSTTNHIQGETVVTNTGMIQSGRFVGAKAVEIAVLANPNPLDCLAPPGVTELSGIANLLVTTP